MDDNMNTALADAAYYNHARAVEYLLQNGADATIQAKNGGKTALVWALERNCKEAIRILNKYDVKS